ncbi:MAG: CHAD domain-containing protein [Bryobacteraceae bacterium]
MKHKKLRWEPETEVAENAGAVLPRMAEDYFRSGRKASKKKTTPEKLHEFRLRTKHFRYLLEFFAPLYGSKLAKPMESLRRIQTLLGELNDYAVTRRMMRDEPEAGRLMEHLDELEARRRAEFRAYWREQFDADGEEEKWLAMLNQARMSRITSPATSVRRKSRPL